jgi:GT2 family glycosyltransferase
MNSVAPAGSKFVSVIIASHGRPAALVECLHCLQNQDLDPGAFEVIIGDDASPVPVSQALEHLAPELAGFYKVIRLERSMGPGGARNAAIGAAQAPLLAFTDDDCLPDPDWLQRLWEAHQQHPSAMLGGSLYNAVPEFFGAEASQVISDIVYAWYNSDAENSRFFSTNNAAVPKEMLLELGGFHSAFQGASEDRDLCDRWRFAGHKMVYVPGARVGHAHRLTINKFVRQHFGYGRGAATFHNERSARGSGRIQDEMPFHRALPRLAWNRLRREPLVKAIAMSGMLGLWQAANAAGYAWQRWSR